MGVATRLSFEEFLKLQEAADETARYELDEGEPLLAPSPAPWHNIVCLRLRRLLADFVEKYHLGLVLGEVDFRLSKNTVRKPDVAFLAKDRMKNLDLHHAPIENAPTLAVEVISSSNLAQDTLKKVRQYLAAGAEAVWLVYPALQLIEVHERTGIREVAQPDVLVEERLFPGLRLAISLVDLFDTDLYRS